jgi:hypothetical protein
MAASMPVQRPRRKSGAVTSCPKDTEGAELHKRSAEASGFDSTARHGRTGHKERTPWEVSYGIERTMTKKTAAQKARCKAKSYEPSRPISAIKREGFFDQPRYCSARDKTSVSFVRVMATKQLRRSSSSSAGRAFG